MEPPLSSIIIVARQLIPALALKNSSPFSNFSSPPSFTPSSNLDLSIIYIDSCANMAYFCETLACQETPVSKVSREKHGRGCLVGLVLVGRDGFVNWQCTGI